LTPLDVAGLVLAGLGGGLTGSVAGLASLVSYPALLAVGLAPVTANVSNTVALVSGSVGSIWGSRPELVGQRERTKRLAVVALIGGIVGGGALLATPSGSFARIVPWLIGLASLGILVRRDPARLAPAGHRPSRAMLIGVFAVAVYSGYFGAGAGVVLVAFLTLSSPESLARNNAVKNVILGLSNGVAALAFVAFGPVRWQAVIPLAAGFLVGGRLGPMVVRRVPAGGLRVVIACAGVGLAVHLGLDAYR
jgi:uncharacterized membrane protein YfcA